MMPSYSSILVLSLAVSLASSKVYDPWIICYGEVPPEYWGWPIQADPLDYDSNMDLCSVANGLAYKNVGCYCTSGEANVFCDRGSTWLPFRSWRFNANARGFTSFPNFCYANCACTNEQAASIWRNSNPEGGLSAINLAGVFANALAISGGGGEIASGQTGNVTATNNTAGGVDASECPDNNGTEGASGNCPASLCANVCESQADCISGCSCRVDSETFVPGQPGGDGSIVFTSACMLLSGKRTDPAPCPCNGTYVSHACCDAPDGYVWEGAEAKLGELAPGNVKPVEVPLAREESSNSTDP